MDPTLSNNIKIGILGASGYTGAELVRLLARHPFAEIVVMTADSNAGEPYEKVYPHLGGLDLPALVKVDEVKWDGIDVDTVFCGLPHGNTQEFIAGFMQNTQHSVLNAATQINSYLSLYSPILVIYGEKFLLLNFFGISVL